jgi:hypothetical protein
MSLHLPSRCIPHNLAVINNLPNYLKLIPLQLYLISSLNTSRTMMNLKRYKMSVFAGSPELKMKKVTGIR